MSVRLGLWLALSTMTCGCIVDRSALAGGGPDAPEPDAGVADLDAPGLDATLEEDAAADDAATVGDDALTACPAERCNAQDDDCDGQVDEAGCDRSLGPVSVSCDVFVYERHVYQVCKASAGVAFDAAQEACWRGTGYDLVRLDSYDEGTTVARRLTTDGWIGLTDRELEGTFVWVRDGAADTLGNWRPSEPDSARSSGNLLQNCVVMKPTALWADLACGTRADPSSSAISAFVCEAPVVP